jgi:hypothetical protein
MPTNRRNVLIALGAAATAAGGAFGSSAFTSVEAERTVNMETAGDGSGLVQLSGSDSEIITTETAGAGTNSVIKLNQTALNENATTTYSGVLTVTNTGTKDVGLSVDNSQGTDPNGLVGSALDIEDNSDSSSIVDTGDGSAAVNLTANGGSVTLSVVIDLRNNTTADMSTIGSIVFAARTGDFV